MSQVVVVDLLAGLPYEATFCTLHPQPDAEPSYRDITFLFEDEQGIPDKIIFTREIRRSKLITFLQVGWCSPRLRKWFGALLVLTARDGLVHVAKMAVCSQQGLSRFADMRLREGRVNLPRFLGHRFQSVQRCRRVRGKGCVFSERQ